MLQQVLLLFCVLITIANFENVDQKQFYVISTTQNPHESQNTDNLFKKQLEFCLRMEETNRRLSTIESQLQKALVDERSRNEKLSQELTRIETLLANEQKNHQGLIEKMHSYDQKLAAHQKGVESQPMGKNCKEIRDQGKSISGVYVIRPKLQAFEVFCDMETNGGGWIVFQRRIDGSQDFNLTWKEYKEGFGNLSREFWLGLEYLHQITDSGGIEIFIELVDRNHEKRFASYDNFSVGSEEGGYKLKSLGTYSGTAGESLLYHVGHKFLTTDKDTNCAAQYRGGWWFSNCLYSNLNGVYFKNGANSGRAQGINWFTFSTDQFSLLEAKMMIRPK